MADEKIVNGTDAVIYVSSDKMLATITLRNEEIEYTVDDITKYLKDNGIVQGIDTGAITQMLSNKKYNVPVLIAAGKKPEDGQDGRFDILCLTESIEIGDEELQNNNYNNSHLFEAVREGQPLARYIPATAGKFGFNIMGQLVNPKKGKELPPLKGKGIVISEDRKVYTAAYGGRVIRTEDRLEVSKVLTINGNINSTVGNIKFDGDIIIKGDVLSGFNIEAKGDVEIDGHFERSNIKCNNLLVKAGVQGGGVSKIEARGNVVAKFFEHVNIEAQGNVTTNYIMNSNIECQGIVKTVGNKAAIIGGDVYAFSGIITNNLGNSAEIPTHASIGVNGKLLEQYNDVTKQIQKKESEYRTFKKAKDDLVSKYTQIQLGESEMFDKINLALEVINQNISELNTKKDEFLALAADLASREIIVNGYVYPNVRLIIDMKELNVEQEITSVTFKASKEKIMAYKL